MSDKQQLRAQFKALRRKLKDAQKDFEIAERVYKTFDFESYFVYLSFGSEADTHALIEMFKRAGKKICVPLVSGAEMLSVLLPDRLKKGAFGIWEPEGGEEETCEAAIVPMLAFDENGYRLGYGGGYYDRYFSTHPEVFRIGIAYEGQFSEQTFFEEFDVPLDALVTEERFLLFTPRAREKVSCG